jgi:hypothetical protein
MRDQLPKLTVSQEESDQLLQKKIQMDDERTQTRKTQTLRWLHDQILFS